MAEQHCVVTRFNLRYPEYQHDKNQQSVADDAWMEHRFALFERYCLPSLSHQSVQDFRWFVFFDIGTSERWRTHLTTLQERCPQLEPIFLDGVDIAGAINERLPADCERLITTRIDNDDAYHHDALARIRQAAAKAGERALITFRYGLNFDGQEAVISSHRNNPFASLLESRSGDTPFQTIHCNVPHGRLHEIAPVHRISGAPYWMTVVHERNLVNRRPNELRSYNLAKPKEVLKYLRKRWLKPVGIRLRRLFWPAPLRKHWTPGDVEAAFL